MTSGADRFALGAWRAHVPLQGHSGMSGPAQLTYLSRHKYLPDKDPSSPTWLQGGQIVLPQPGTCGGVWGWESLSCLKFFGEEAGYKQMKGLVVSELGEAWVG